MISLTEEDDVAEFPAAGAHHRSVVVARVDEEHADVGENAADGEGDGADRPLGRRPQVLNGEITAVGQSIKSIQTLKINSHRNVLHAQLPSSYIQGSAKELALYFING